MKAFKRAHEEFGFHNAQNHDGAVMHKDVNDNKIKLYQKINFEGFPQMTINRKDLFGKVILFTFLFVSFLGFLGLFVNATNFNQF